MKRVSQTVNYLTPYFVSFWLTHFTSATYPFGGITCRFVEPVDYASVSISSMIGSAPGRPGRANIFSIMPLSSSHAM